MKLAATSPSSSRTVYLLACMLACAALALDWQRLQPGPQLPLRQATAELAMLLLHGEPPPSPDAATDPAARESPHALRVLFVGNGLTTHHDMPSMIAQLAKSARQWRPFVWRVSSIGNKLKDQMAQGQAAEPLQQARWDAVVVQEHGALTSLSREGREHWVLPYARQLHAAAERAGVRTVLFQTFARCRGDLDDFEHDDYESMQTRVIDAYREMAEELHAEQVPIGAIWRELYYAHPELHLWESDGTMPSRAGSYLAACAFYAHFYGQSPEGLPYTAELDPRDAEEIQRTVASVMFPAK